MLCQVDNKFIGDRMMIIKKYNNMTLAELVNIYICISILVILTPLYPYLPYVCSQENSKSLSSLSSSCISGNSISNITSTIKISKKNIKRSSSCAGDDEGKK